MNMLEAMAARVSTRSFDAVKFTGEETRRLEAKLSAAQSEETPFGNRVRLALYEGGEGNKPVKLGTYGLISGASAFIVPAVSAGSGAMEDAGYILEKAVLEATALGFSSCWIGGVFNRGKAAEAVAAVAGELVPGVVALGKPAARRSLADKIVTGTAKSRLRKPLELIAFAQDGMPLGEPWLSVVSAARGAPSASNKQPWRFLRLSGGGEWVLFMEEDWVYNNSLGDVHLQNLDMGIAMRHFFEAAKAAGLPGRWSPLPVGQNAPESALLYGKARSWKPIAVWS